MQKKHKDYLNSCCNALSKVDLYACDIETTGFDIEFDRITGISFSVKPDKKHSWWFSFEDMPFIETMRNLYPFLTNPTKTSVWHNAKFDLKFLKYNGYEVKTQLHDTLLIAFADDENRAGGGLALKGETGLVNQLFKIVLPTFKDSELAGATLFPIKTADDYATDDTIYTLKVFNKLYPRIKKHPRVLKFYQEVSLPLLRIVSDMEYHGVLIDVDYLKEGLDKVLKDQKHFEEEMVRISGVNFSPTSDEQVSKVIYSETGLNLEPHPTVPKMKKGYYSVAANMFEGLWEHPFVKNLLKHRGASKLVSTYLKPWIKKATKSPTGRVRGSFNQAGAKSGRFSSSNPNLQNLPRSYGADWKYTYPIRNAFIAPEGKKILTFDYCLSEGTKVALDYGTVPIEQVCSDDNVVQEDGSLEKVNNLIYRGIKTCYTLVLDDGSSINCTKEHRFRVINKSGKYVWKRLKHITQDDFVCLSTGWLRGDYRRLPQLFYSHFNNKKVSVPLQTDEEFARFCGYLTGDGCFGKSSIGWVVCDKDRDLNDMLESSFNKILNARKYVSKYRGIIEHKIHSIPLKEWFSEVGVNKQNVPPFIWLGGSKMAGHWLSGLFESDGSVCSDSTGRVSFCSSRESLSKDVQLLLRGLGICSTLRKQKASLPGKNGNDLFGYHVIITSIGLDIFKQKVGFLSKRKQNKLSKLINSKIKRNPKCGGLPNQKERVKRLKLSGEVRRLLNNTSVKNTPINPIIVNTLKKDFPDVYNKLNLDNCLDYFNIGMYAKKVQKIVKLGKVKTFDLEVSNTNTFIANGFVSHNSQLELRVMAHRSKDPAMLKIYRDGGDIHKNTQDMLNVSRPIAKGTNFGLLYRMGAEKFQRHIKDQSRIMLPLAECKRIKSQFFKTYSGIKKYHDIIEQEVISNKIVYTITGRPRNLKSLYKESEYKAVTVGINTTIQGSAADIVSLGMRNFRRGIDKRAVTNPLWKEVFLIMQVHDEVSAECPDELVEECMVLLRESLENCVKLSVPLIAEGSYSDSWGKNK